VGCGAFPAGMPVFAGCQYVKREPREEPPPNFLPGDLVPPAVAAEKLRSRVGAP
jgi:hypothetical protein